MPHRRVATTADDDAPGPRRVVADSVQRETRRRQLDEPYRTVLGRLRHEIAHYYQPILAPEGTPTRDECRRVFV